MDLSLTGALVEVDSEQGFEVCLQYRDRRIQIPLTYSVADRHITLCTLNQRLAPEFEVRICVNSDGSDTLAFLSLPCEQWAAFEQQYSEAVRKRFYRLTARPDVFTDPFPPAGRST